LALTAPTEDIDLDLSDRDDPRPDIPSREELQLIIANATGRWRPLLLVAIFAGLRSSEIRGLTWTNVDFDKRHISVTQRADTGHRIGRCKSKAAYRSIPIPPIVVSALREWKLQCPRGDLDLVFPSRTGKVESHASILQRGLHRILKIAGITHRYGMHSLRHACVSLWIEAGRNPKQVHRLAGHSSIQMTFDVYGHLFADPESDQKAAENVQISLLGM
jgi:integrase